MNFKHCIIPLLALVALIPAESAPLSPQAIVENYQAAVQDERNSLHGASMEIDIDASLPKLQKNGRLHALRRISSLGRITYEALRFEGDSTVKNNVIARYITAEAESQKSQTPDLSVIPANYKFKYKGQIQGGGRDVYLFQVSRRKKRVGLYKGEIWIDAGTFQRVREAGTF